MQELIAKLRTHAITPLERQQLIEELSPLAIRIAKNLAVGGSRRRRDDLIAQGQLLLIHFIDLAPTSLHDNEIEKYLSFSVRNSLIRYIKEDNVLLIPEKSQRRTGLQPHQQEVLETGFFEDFNLQEEIEDLTSVPEEQKILSMRIEGYTFKEIGKELGRAESYVHKICGKIAEIYEARNGQHRRRSQL